jgi:small conductance mechanosensitive channel
VGIKEFSDSAIILQIIVWAPQDQFLDVKFGLNKAILEQFIANKVVIPFPQRDVHIYQKP